MDVLTLMRYNGVSGSTAFLHCEGKTEKLLGTGLLEEIADLKWVETNWMGWGSPREIF
jgi:hypothetical protein